MKTIASDETYIDYWHRRGYSCVGVRVWPGYCRVVASDPEQGPEDLTELGEAQRLPVEADISLRKACAHTAQPTVEGEIVWHMMCAPNSELLCVLKGQKSFSDALTSTCEESLSAAAG